MAIPNIYMANTRTSCFINKKLLDIISYIDPDTMIVVELISHSFQWIGHSDKSQIEKHCTLFIINEINLARLLLTILPRH